MAIVIYAIFILYFLNIRWDVKMTRVRGIVRYEITIQCPICGHIDVVEANDLPMDNVIECLECEEELLVVLDEDGEYLN